MALFDTTGQGLEGAGFSLKEALSGDIQSLAERFNISKGLIRAFKIDELGKKGNIDEFITQFEKLLDAQKMGIEAYETMLKDPKVKLDMFISNIKTSFAEASTSAIESIAPLIDKFNNWFKSDKSSKFFNVIAKVFEWIVTKGIFLFDIISQGTEKIKNALNTVGGGMFSKGLIGNLNSFVDLIGWVIDKTASFASFIIETLGYNSAYFNGINRWFCSIKNIYRRY